MTSERAAPLSERGRANRRYMHTINGKPGGWDGDQIVYADEMPNWLDEPMPVQAYRTLRTLARHVAATKRYRRARKFDLLSVYGWCVVEVRA
jgi:hypothetical protein